MTTAVACGPPLLRLPLRPEILAEEVVPAGDRSSRLARFLGGDMAAFGGLTVGDLLYDAFRVDPTAIAGMDFARAADLSDILAFSRFARGLSDLAEGQLAGNLAQLHGYVAEHVVASALLAEGADVEFPASSIQPGWDILVNCEPFQVACLATPDGVHEHLARYPEIPVIANCELADFFVGDPRVATLGSLSYEDVVGRSRETLEAGADLLDLQIPLIAGTVAVLRAAVAVLKRQSEPWRAVAAATFDGASGTAGAAGGAAGTAASIALLGIVGGWAAIIAPVFGGVAGYKVGRAVADRLKTHLLCRAESRRLDEAVRAFAREAAAVLGRMLASSLRFREAIRPLGADASPFARTMQQDWLRRVEREIERRQFHRKKLLAAAADPQAIAPRSRDPRDLARSVIWTAARGGVLQANIPHAARQVKEAIGAYQEALRRWLM